MANKFKSAVGFMLKSTLAILLFWLLVMIFGYIALEYGINMENAVNSVNQYWLVWLFVRLVIYTISGILLYKIRHYAKNQADLTAYTRLTVACLIGMIGLEMAILLQ